MGEEEGKVKEYGTVGEQTVVILRTTKNYTKNFFCTFLCFEWVTIDTVIAKEDRNRDACYWDIYL